MSNQMEEIEEELRKKKMEDQREKDAQVIHF